MLKIKESVDLKELEKFGFEIGEDGYIYDFIPYTQNDYEYILVTKDTRQIITDYVDLDYFNKALGILYDLIKADLVEKVEEENETD